MIKLYRNILRQIKRTLLLFRILTVALDKGVRKELRDNIRYEFERHRNEKDMDKIKYYLSQGQRQYHQLQSAIELSVTK